MGSSENPRSDDDRADPLDGRRERAADRERGGVSGKPQFAGAGEPEEPAAGGAGSEECVRAVDGSCQNLTVKGRYHMRYMMWVGSIEGICSYF